ncbi:hypothetical protein [Azospirillum palustre]
MIHSAVIDHGRGHGGVLRFEGSCLRQGFCPVTFEENSADRILHMTEETFERWSYATDGA